MENGLSVFSLKGQVVILTGAAGFLGKKYAKALGQAGAVVSLWDKIDLALVKQQADELAKENIEAVAFSVDITDEEAVKQAIGQLTEKYGRIDVLINNAAMNPAIGSEESKKQFVPVEEYPVELWRKELDANLTGMFICSKNVAAIMKKQGKGVIVNVASEVSNIAHDHRVYNAPGKYKSPTYVTSKTGVLGLTRSLAAQLGEHNIRVNAFSPGGVENAKMPADFVERFSKTTMLGRMAKEKEYNGAIIFLCSEASSFMTGANLTIDGGKSSW